MYKIEEIKTAVNNIAGMFPLKQVILVGSYAKEAATPDSDIDLVVDGDDLSDVYWDFLFKLEDTFDAKVDLLTLRGLRNSCIKKDVLEGGIVLYEA